MTVTRDDERPSASPLIEVSDLEPPRFVGTPSERAGAVVETFSDRLAPDVTGRGSRLLAVPAIASWVEDSMAILDKTFPSELEYMVGTADAMGVPVEHVFAAHHASLFPDIDHDSDGCTVAASTVPGGGAWLVKNRDNHPDVRRRHLVSLHTDPAWGGHSVVGISRAGGPFAASSGINTRGLATVDTSILVAYPPPGIHRTIVMGGLLSTCTTVDEALELMGSFPHLGGTITIGDATGAVATVELEPDAILIERPAARPWVARTNHCVSRSVPRDGDAEVDHRSSSRLRLRRMQEAMSKLHDVGVTWEEIEPWIAAQMCRHDGDGAPCRHEEEAVTIATSIYTCDPPSLLTSVGAGCEGRWARWAHAQEGGA